MRIDGRAANERQKDQPVIVLTNESMHPVKGILVSGNYAHGPLAKKSGLTT